MNAIEFVAARGLGNAHLQTIFANLGRLGRGPVYSRERLDLPDGDFIDVDTATPERPAPGAPWALVLHGLEGSSRSTYVRGVARALVARGIEACCMNYRGCSGEPNRLARSYHMGESLDVRFVLERLRERRSGRACAVIGYSCGANLVLKLLGELGEGGPSELRAGVGVSAPFELALASRHLDGPRAGVYRAHLLGSLKRKALAKLEKFPAAPVDRAALRGARTFTAYDRLFTAPLHGFRDELEYWDRSSGTRYVGGIRRDLLLISALDDPFFPPGYVPRALLATNPRIQLLAADRGGHVGFVGGAPWAPTFWAEERALEFVASRIVGEPAPAPAASSDPSLTAPLARS